MGNTDLLVTFKKSKAAAQNNAPAAESLNISIA